MGGGLTLSRVGPIALAFHSPQPVWPEKYKRNTKEIQKKYKRNTIKNILKNPVYLLSDEIFGSEENWQLELGGRWLP